jgi:perosamine synthetase
MKSKIPLALPDLNGNELKYLQKCIKSSWISSSGEFINRFEEGFAKYCERKYGVSTSNGTSALHLALLALGIKKGDEVIIPNLTFIATANAVRHCGAKPVLVDVTKDYWGIDPTEIEKKINSKTKAIIPVHLYGHPCAMDPIMEIARKYSLFVIEDVAEAHGAEYKGKKVGSFGDISCFSFYGNKVITTGEGGICLTDNKELTEKIKVLRGHGMERDRQYWHHLMGFNYRMTNMQAAVGCAQLEKLKDIVERKRKIAKTYNNLLKDLEIQGKIVLPVEMPGAKNVYWMYSILIDNKSRINRDKLIEILNENNIESRPFFYPLHIMPLDKQGGVSDFPISSYLSKKGINLPSFPGISENQIKRVVNLIKKSL